MQGDDVMGWAVGGTCHSLEAAPPCKIRVKTTWKFLRPESEESERRKKKTSETEKKRFESVKKRSERKKKRSEWKKNLKLKKIKFTQKFKYMFKWKIHLKKNFWIHFGIFQVQEKKIETFSSIFIFQLQFYFFRWNCFCKSFKLLWAGCASISFGPDPENGTIEEQWKIFKQSVLHVHCCCSFSRFCQREAERLV